MRQRVVVMSLEDLKKIKNPEKRRKAHIFKINKPARNITPEQENEMLQNLFEEMHADRIAHERRMQKSMEYARTFYT